jgi:hypothetical protein
MNCWLVSLDFRAGNATCKGACLDQLLQDFRGESSLSSFKEMELSAVFAFDHIMERSPVEQIGKVLR